MTKNLHTLKPNNSIAEVTAIFDQYKIHHIPIAIDDALVGIVSMTDYLFFRKGFLNTNEDQILEKTRMNNYEVKHIMTKGVSTMASTESINIALDIFKDNIIHAIPIVDDGKLVGIVTTHDIIYHLAKDNEAYAEYD